MRFGADLRLRIYLERADLLQQFRCIWSYPLLFDQGYVKKHFLRHSATYFHRGKQQFSKRKSGRECLMNQVMPSFSSTNEKVTSAKMSGILWYIWHSRYATFLHNNYFRYLALTFAINVWPLRPPLIAITERQGARIVMWNFISCGLLWTLGFLQSPHDQGDISWQEMK